MSEEGAKGGHGALAVISPERSVLQMGIINLYLLCLSSTIYWRGEKCHSIQFLCFWSLWSQAQPGPGSWVLNVKPCSELSKNRIGPGWLMTGEPETKTSQLQMLPCVSLLTPRLLTSDSCSPHGQGQLPHAQSHTFIPHYTVPASVKMSPLHTRVYFLCVSRLLVTFLRH